MSRVEPPSTSGEPRQGREPPTAARLQEGALFAQSAHLGWRLTWRHLASARWMRMALLVSSLAVAIIATLEYRAGAAFALNRFVRGGLLGLVVPAFALAITTGSSMLAARVQELGGFGANRRALALGTSFAKAAAAALTATSWGVLAQLAMASGPTSLVPGLGKVTLACATAGVCYSLLCDWGRSIHVRGAGALLCLDWLLGYGQGLAADFVPRSHLRHLADPLFGHSNSATLWALAAIASVAVSARVWRVAP